MVIFKIVRLPKTHLRTLSWICVNFWYFTSGDSAQNDYRTQRRCVMCNNGLIDEKYRHARSSGRLSYFFTIANRAAVYVDVTNSLAVAAVTSNCNSFCFLQDNTKSLQRISCEAILFFNIIIKVAIKHASRTMEKRQMSKSVVSF